MKTAFKLTILSALIFTVFAFKSASFDGVKGWFLVGSDPQSYEIGTERNPERTSTVAFLKSKNKSSGFGTITQSFSASNYLDKRVRLTGYIKSSEVKNWAGMWFRVDDEKYKILSFDNMQKRPIKGNNTWKQYSIILDVPNESKNITYGVLLEGEGQVWIDDFKFEVVDTTVATTQMILKDK